MRLHEFNHAGGYIAQALRESRSHEAPRTGLHVSTILDAWLRAIDPKAYAIEFTEDHKHGYQEIGNIVEDVLADWLRRRVAGWEKPEPRIHRGITGSPDGWSPRSRALHEIKACWKSEKLFTTAMREFAAGTFDLIDLVRVNLKLYFYILQLLTYAEMWDADRGYLHVLFVNGNYQPPAPTMHTYTIVWTKGERRGNFDSLKQFADDRGLAA